MVIKNLFLPSLLALCSMCPQWAVAQTSPVEPLKQESAPTATDLRVTPAAFDGSAATALQAMKSRAEELKIGGVAVLAYFDGDTVQSWTSKMLVVGRMKDDPSATGKGNNLLGIAYAKAAEMADTLKDSGSQARPPMTGEFGWQGGIIVHVKTGYIIVAFSGGKSEDDVEVSRSGAARILQSLRAAR